MFAQGKMMNRLCRGLALILLALIPPATAADAPVSAVPLTMSDAIARALSANLDVRVAAARTDQARARAMREASDLLPQVTGTARQARVFKVNLEAQGFNFPGMDPLIGPFNTFD